MKVQAPSWRGPSEFDWFHLHYDRKSYRTKVKFQELKKWETITCRESIYSYIDTSIIYFPIINVLWFLKFRKGKSWLMSDMISGHNEGGISRTPTAPASWGPELSYTTIRYQITLLQIVEIAAKVNHLWIVKLMKNQKKLNLYKNGFYHWNQGSMDFQIKCRSNKISKMSKFKKLVGNGPMLTNLILKIDISLENSNHFPKMGSSGFVRDWINHYRSQSQYPSN